MAFNDKISDMVEELKNTNEYKEYMVLKEELKKDRELYSLVREFKKKQNEHQIKYINGEKMSDNDSSVMQNIYSIIIRNDIVRRLLDDEVKLNMMLGEVQKNIAEAIKEIVDY